MKPDKSIMSAREFSPIFITANIASNTPTRPSPAIRPLGQIGSIIFFALLILTLFKFTIWYKDKNKAS